MATLLPARSRLQEGAHAAPAAALERVVGNASSVSRQVFKRIQSVEVVDGYRRHSLWFSETEVDRNAAAPLLRL